MVKHITNGDRSGDSVASSLSQGDSSAPALIGLAEETVEVRNHSGLHIRPSAMVAKKAIKYLSRITITRGDSHADARSATSVEMLKAKAGAHLKIKAVGPDAKDALNAIKALFENRFGEDR